MFCTAVWSASFSIALCYLAVVFIDAAFDYLLLNLMSFEFVVIVYLFDDRVATRPGFPGMSRICAVLSRVPARPVPGRQMSRISRCSQNDNDNNNNNSNNRRDSSNLI